MIKANLEYLWYILRHKYYVLIAGIKLGVPLHILIAHDLSKFTPSEWLPYVKNFYMPGKQNFEEFNRAWLHHVHHNKHHWGYWYLVKDTGNPDIVFSMPDVYIKEMVADWVGAGLAQGKPDFISWYNDNKDKMILADDTRKRVEELLYGYGK